MVVGDAVGRRRHQLGTRLIRSDAVGAADRMVDRLDQHVMDPVAVRREQLLQAGLGHVLETDLAGTHAFKFRPRRPVEMRPLRVIVVVLGQLARVQEFLELGPGDEVVGRIACRVAGRTRSHRSKADDLGRVGLNRSADESGLSGTGRAGQNDKGSLQDAPSCGG